MDTALTAALPYSFARLDDLMEKAGIDVLLVTSKHNTQYLLGGYRFIFFQAMDAIGTVTSQAASGSFQAAGENVTRSSETRIVAGRVMEKTNVPNRSAWRFPNRPNRRSPAPITKRRRNSERGEDVGENMGEERNRKPGRYWQKDASLQHANMPPIH